MSSLTTLSEAVRHWERGERSTALATLVDLWREVKWPSLGDAIGALTNEASKQRAPIRPTGPKSAAELWREVDAQRDPLDLPRLLEPMPKATTALQRERITAMQEWPTHPLLSRAIVGWWETFFVTVPVEPLSTLLERHADPAVSARLTALAPTPRAAAKWVGRHNAPRLLALVATSTEWKAAPCSEEEASLVDRLAQLAKPAEATAPADDLAALFSKVHAHPEDDAVRALVADALASRGDPRGEFISLQLLRADAVPSKRERQLEDEWRDTWLGRLAPCFRKGVRFSRGFPAEGAYEKGGDPSWPEWATFEALDFSPASGFISGGAPLLVHGRFPLLEKVVGLGRPALDLTNGVNLLSLTQTRWTTLGVQCVEGFFHAAEQLFTPERFPSVEVFELGPVPGWTRCWDPLVARVTQLPWFRQVKQLEVCAGPSGVTAALQANVEQVTVRDVNELASAKWTPRVGRLELSIHRVAPRSAELPALALQLLDRDALREVSLTLPRCKRAGAVLTSGRQRLDVAPLVTSLEALTHAKVSLPE